MQKWWMLAIGVSVLGAATSTACFSASQSPATVTGKPNAASNSGSAPVSVAEQASSKVSASAEGKALVPALITAQVGHEFVATVAPEALGTASGDHYVAYSTRDRGGANQLELAVFRKQVGHWSAPAVVAADAPNSIHLVATSSGVVVVWRVPQVSNTSLVRARAYSLESNSFGNAEELGRVFDDDWAFTSNGGRAYAGFAGSPSESNNPGHLLDPATGRWLATRGVNGRGVALTSNGDLSWFDWTTDKAKPFGIFSSNRERVPFGFFLERPDDGNGYPGADLGFALPGHGTFMRLHGRQFSFDESNRSWTELPFSRACEGQAALEDGTVLGSRFEGTRWVMCTMTGAEPPRELVAFPNVQGVLVATSGNQVALTTEDTRRVIKLVRFDARAAERRVEEVLDLGHAKPRQIRIGGGVTIAYVPDAIAGRSGLYAVTRSSD